MDGIGIGIGMDLWVGGGIEHQYGANNEPSQLLT